MAKMMDSMFKFFKLPYADNEGYEEGEEDDLYEAPVKKEVKNTKSTDKLEKEDEGESFRRNTTGKTAAARETSWQSKTDSSQTESFFANSNSRVGRSANRPFSNVSVVKGESNMESEIVSIRPKDDSARREIGDNLLQGKTVLINMESLEVSEKQRIIDFTYGVCFAIHGTMHFPSKYIVVAAPHEVSLSGEYEDLEEASKHSDVKPRFEY